MNASAPLNRQRKQVISLQIDQISFEGALNKVLKLAAHRQSSYICFANVHMSIEAHKDPAFAATVNHADLVCADGVPVAKAMKSLYGIDQERIAGMDFLPAILQRMHDHNDLTPVYFYGSTQAVLDKLQAVIHQQWPRVNRAGFFSPPFRPLSAEEQDQYLQTIRNSGAGLVFVGLGCPKQEKWMAAHTHRLDAVLLGVGGAFMTTAGLQKRAPAFMQRLGMEWFYRLLQEPRRLFHRYFVTNTTFLFLMTKALAKRRRYGKS